MASKDLTTGLNWKYDIVKAINDIIKQTICYKEKYENKVIHTIV